MEASYFILYVLFLHVGMSNFSDQPNCLEATGTKLGTAYALLINYQYSLTGKLKLLRVNYQFPFKCVYITTPVIDILIGILQKL